MKVLETRHHHVPAALYPFDALVVIVSNMPNQPAVIIIARFVVQFSSYTIATDTTTTDTATDSTQQTKAGTLPPPHLTIHL